MKKKQTNNTDNVNKKYIQEDKHNGATGRKLHTQDMEVKVT